MSEQVRLKAWIWYWKKLYWFTIQGVKNDKLKQFIKILEYYINEKPSFFYSWIIISFLINLFILIILKYYFFIISIYNAYKQ